MKMLSSITLPKVVSNQYKFISSVEHKRRYFEDLSATRQSYAQSQCGPSTVWLLTFFKISSFAFIRRKKFIHVKGTNLQVVPNLYE